MHGVVWMREGNVSSMGQACECPWNEWDEIWMGEWGGVWGVLWEENLNYGVGEIGKPGLRDGIGGEEAWKSFSFFSSFSR